jgi:hypothetical protein
MIELLGEEDYPLMHVQCTAVNYSVGERSFSFDIVLADIPRDKEYSADYQKEIISDMIQIGEDLISEIRNGSIVFGPDVTLGDQIQFTPFIADYTHTLSGITLSIDMAFPYNWNACDIPADWSIQGSGSGSGSGSYGLILRTNGTANAVQSILDLVNGSNITIEDLGNGSVRINSSGGVVSVSWGDILGTLSDQIDLQDALDLKVDISSLAAVATTGDYLDLINTPTIPTELRDLTDVDISSPQQNDTLLFNSSTNEFVNGQLGAVAYSNDYNDLDNTPTLPPTIGDMLKSVYDTDDDGIVDKAESIQIIVRNSTGSTLNKGSVVYLSGATGNRPNAVLADASSESTSSKTIGIVVSNISNNSEGQVAVNGTLHDLDTSSFTAGDTLWLSEVAGQVQANTPPAEPAHAVFIGYVARSHPNIGRIVIQIQNGYELNELHGVEIVSPSTNDALIYDTDGLWKNKQIGTDMIVNNSSVVGGNTSEALDTLANDIGGKVDTSRTINTDAPLSGGGDLSGDLTISIPKATAIDSGYLDSGDFSTFEGKQDPISLTTTGSNGPATLIGNTLNIPNYTTSTGAAVIKSINQFTHTGTTAETIVFSGLLPISLAANDQIDFSHFLGSNVTNGSTIIWKGYINTQNNLTGAIEIYRFNNSSGTATGTILGRRMMVNVVGPSGVVRFFNPSSQPTLFQPFFSANAVLLTGTINTTGNIYFILTCAISASPFIAQMFHTNISIIR